jgi:hypothetical protein
MSKAVWKLAWIPDCGKTTALLPTILGAGGIKYNAGGQLWVAAALNDCIMGIFVLIDGVPQPLLLVADCVSSSAGLASKTNGCPKSGTQFPLRDLR